MRKAKGYKKTERQTFNDGVKAHAPAPKFATVPVSGGTDAGEGGKNFDKAIARKSKAPIELKDGLELQPISGSGQKGELATKLSASSGKQLQKKFRKPDGRLGSISEYSGFAKASKELGND